MTLEGKRIHQGTTEQAKRVHSTIDHPANWVRPSDENMV